MKHIEMSYFMNWLKDLQLPVYTSHDYACFNGKKSTSLWTQNLNWT